MVEKIQVAVRIRPLLNHENEHQLINYRITDNSILLNNLEDRLKSFKFDKVFQLNVQQKDVYGQLNIQNLVQKVVEGYHATIFAYGQTGSGKTFTMQGQEQLGIIQRSIYDLYKQIQKIKQQESKHIQIYVSFYQIYNEKVLDLLNNDSLNKRNQGLRIRWTKKEQFIVENLYVFECKSVDDIIDLFNYGNKNKVTASHNLNQTSSRSHSIFTITIESLDQSDNHVISKLQLVDLAGSERISQTGNTGQQAKESIDINKSLFVLRNVINKLTEGNLDYIPYRDSKLTSLLKQSLGGNSYCLMIACVSPSQKFIEETLSTLSYAA